MQSQIKERDQEIPNWYVNKSKEPIIKQSTWNIHTVEVKPNPNSIRNNSVERNRKKTRAN